MEPVSQLHPSVTVSLLFCLSLHLRSLSLLSLLFSSVLSPCFPPYFSISLGLFYFPFSTSSVSLAFSISASNLIHICLFCILSTLQALPAGDSPQSYTHVPNEETFPQDAEDGASLQAQLSACPPTSAIWFQLNCT